MKRFLSGPLYVSIRRIPATMIGKPLGIQPALCKAVHLPWLAEKTAGPAVLRSPTLVMCHCLMLHVCHLRADGDCLFSSPPPWGHRTRRYLFLGPRARSFLRCKPYNLAERGYFYLQPFFSRVVDDVFDLLGNPVVDPICPTLGANRGGNLPYNYDT